MSTNHSEKKYISFAKRFRQAILEKFPNVKVYIKSTADDNKITTYKISKDPKGNIIDEQREPLRIGAFEITLAVRKDQFTKNVNIFSKLKANCFPNLPFVLSRICEYVPRGNLCVKICDNVKDPNEKPIPEKAEGMRVKLT